MIGIFCGYIVLEFRSVVLFVCFFALPSSSVHVITETFHVNYVELKADPRGRLVETVVA